MRLRRSDSKLPLIRRLGLVAGLLRPSFRVIVLSLPLVLIPTLSGCRGEASASASPLPPAAVTPELLRGLSWRAIGPTIFGGRVTDVAGIPGRHQIIYVGHASAGLFKSVDGGTTFRPIFDAAGSQSIGAIALAPSDPETIYVGTGEGKPRNSVSFGDGIYKSTDGGATWTHLGLRDSERFSRIVVDPGDANLVYAAAMGHAWGPNEERGLFRSRDGGATWQRILFVNETTGAADVCLDPRDPRIVYAAMYDYLRQPWHFRSGGPGSGLHRSTDGGETWVNLTDPALRNGLPAGPLGRIGIAVCAGRAEVVYAIIESEDPGELWRSDDRGATWRAVGFEREINARPFYFSVIRVDPRDPDRIYSLNRSMWVSDDGGRTWTEIGYWKIFGDHHALWIDPADPDRILNGSDGGFHVSWDRGTNWDFVNTIPMAQAYHIEVDMADPYHVLGGFQDHEVWRGPNEKWNVRGVRDADWVRLRDHGDGMFIVVDRRDPNIVYYGCEPADLTRVDMRTGEERFILPYPEAPAGVGGAARLYRFNWDAPIHMSPSDPDTLYFAGNVLFRTRDAGQTWTIVSPDLTKDEKGKQAVSGGPITADNTGAEIYNTITAVAESPRDRRTIWAGTDDGNLQLTRDGGRTWTNLAANLPGLPADFRVSSICASRYAAGTAYISVDRHTLDEFAPHAFRSDDFGATWEDIAAGLPSYVHIILEDPRQPNLLYAGTELGIFASFDRGLAWTDLRLGLPRLSVMDIKVHPRDNDLIMGTHARGIFILDDIAPLQKLAAAMGGGAAIFEPPRAVRYTPASDVSSLSDRVFAARNKPYGAIISYCLPKEAAARAAEARLEILDGSGRVIRTMPATAHPGINRAVWGLREDPLALVDEALEESWFNPRVNGPRVMPGTYTARLTAGGETVERPFRVTLDPRIRISGKDLAAYDRTVRRLARMQLDVNKALARIERAEREISESAGGGTDAAAASHGEAERAGTSRTAEVRRALNAVRQELRPDPRSPETLSLETRISTLRQQVENSTTRPARAQAEWIEILDGRLSEVLARLEKVLGQNRG